MKFMIVCCLLVCSITAALGEADCVVGDENLMVGDNYYPPGECFAMTCNEDGSLSGSGCPSEFTDDPKCTLVPEDNSKLFPDCCEHYECE